MGDESGTMLRCEIPRSPSRCCAPARRGKSAPAPPSIPLVARRTPKRTRRRPSRGHAATAPRFGRLGPSSQLMPGPWKVCTRRSILIAIEAAASSGCGGTPSSRSLQRTTAAALPKVGEWRRPSSCQSVRSVLEPQGSNWSRKVLLKTLCGSNALNAALAVSQLSLDGTPSR